MESQIFIAIGLAIVTSVLVTGLASSIYTQSNMTGGNMTTPSATDTSGGDGGDGGNGNDDGEDENNDDRGEGNN
jgi:hypothetical protein